MTGGKLPKRMIGAALLLSTLVACGSGDAGRVTNSFFNPEEIPLETYSAEQIFERGEFEIDRQEMQEAAFYFAEIERLYPYSDWARRALVMQAFAYHQDQDYPNSRSAAQRFVDFYPDDSDAAYAQYRMSFLMPGKGKTVVMDSLWKQHFIALGLILAGAALAAIIGSFVSIPDEVAVCTIVVAAGTYCLTLEKK